MHTATASSEALENEATPQMPWPEVQPEESRVPKPTSSPPSASRHQPTAVTKNAWWVAAYSQAPITMARANYRRQSRELRSALSGVT